MSGVRINEMYGSSIRDLMTEWMGSIPPQPCNLESPYPVKITRFNEDGSIEPECVNFEVNI